jgi:hypothetical protein
MILNNPLLSITPENATLIAALIAAVASILALLFNLFADRAEESRAAHRALLAPHLADISEFIYSTVACSKILIEARTEQAVENWRERANTAKDDLKTIRVKLRYPLWGITNPMNTLTRLPDWIEHARPLDPKYAMTLFRYGRSLAHWLDKAIVRSYKDGKAPTLLYRIIIVFREHQFRRAYGQMKSRKIVNHSET